MTKDDHQRVHLPRIHKAGINTKEWTDEEGHMHIAVTDGDGKVIAEMIFDDGEGEKR